MKKYLILALFVGAFLITAPLAAQTVTCTGCTHEMSYYMGEGGFIATAGEDAEKVTWVATCGGVTTSGELTPNDDGKVSALFSMDNGLACHSDSVDDDGLTKNRFRIGPITDGGWYWITDDMNSAIGNLVSMDILENAEVELTSAGDGVSMVDGRGAVYVKEASTGRVGILPNILPEPPAKALTPCGYNDAGRGKTPRYTVKNSACALGDGGTMIRARGAVDPYTGKHTDGTMVRRPLTATNTTVVTVDLWGNGTGHFNQAGTPDGTTTADPRLGHAEVPLVLGGTDSTTDGGFVARIGGIGTTVIGSTPPSAGNPVDGGATFAVTADVGTLTIYADGRYCNPTAKPPVNETEVFTVSAYVGAADTAAGQVTPRIATVSATNRLAAQTKITVVCPVWVRSPPGTGTGPGQPVPGRVS